ncbi:MAG: TadE/TadG family type IV pilus assembly protein [Pseudomonadota bacterium]
MMRIRLPLPRLRFRKFARDDRGVAATEFALIMPLLMTLTFGVFEVYFAYIAEDQFTRYSTQTADLLARAPELKTADIKDLLDVANKIMVEVDSHELIELHVASIGYKTTGGNPLLLWTRSSFGKNGGTPIVFDIKEAEGLGMPGETIIRVHSKYTYTSPFTYFLKVNPYLKEKVLYFKPRVTRAIAIDGSVSEQNHNWDS